MHSLLVGTGALVHVLHTQCNQDRLIRRAYCADRVQALGWGLLLEISLTSWGSLLQLSKNPLTAL